MSEFVSGNIFIRPMHFVKAGELHAGHKHNFDHTTIVFRGAVKVEATLPDGRQIEREFHAPNHFLVRADVTHKIIALVADTECWCVYAHRNAQGEVVQIATGWPAAYV